MHLNKTSEANEDFGSFLLKRICLGLADFEPIYFKNDWVYIQG